LINEKVIIDLVGTSNIYLRKILPKKKSKKTIIILEKNVEKLSFPQIIHNHPREKCGEIKFSTNYPHQTRLFLGYTMIANTGPNFLSWLSTEETMV